MKPKHAQPLHLTKDQYLQGTVDLLVKDPEAWDWMCGWWASDEFRDILDRNQANRLSKPGLHRYDVDRHVRNIQRMVLYLNLFIGLDYVL
jgi:hypothetical protein